MTTPSNKQLREFIVASFSDSDLDIFCFDYFPEVRNNFATGMRQNDKAMDLIIYCQNRDLMANLLVNLQQERPQPYQAQFAPQEKTPARKARPQIQPRNPKQIFISHAEKATSELANRLAKDLNDIGHPVWLAPTSINPGEKWDHAIERGLQESGIFILLLTPDAVDSFWVRKEMGAAMRLQGRGLMRILPLDVQVCELPLFWEDYQFIPFRDQYESGWARLQQALAGKRIGQRKPSTPQKTIVRSTPIPPAPEPDQNTFTHEKTGLEFVRIPAGEFLYGDTPEKREVAEFWMSKTPVTHAVYQRFITATPTYDVPHQEKEWAKPYSWDKRQRTYPPDKADHPMVLVSRVDALAFCEWAKLKLPTEEQWEKAARGTDGRKYPWGNEKPTDKLCNFARKVGRTTPVGQYSPQGDSPYACVDMSGNVWEWCLNKYSNPTVTTLDKNGDLRVLRGGSWYVSQRGARAAYRYLNPPVHRSYFSGFRVVWVRRSPSHNH